MRTQWNAGDGPLHSSVSKIIMCIIKFMFDWGETYSSVWSVNKESEEKFGEGVLSLERFPLSNELKTEIQNLCTEYQTALNWDEPQAGIVWSKEQIEDFRARALIAYNQFVDSIGDDIVVENGINF